MARFLLTHDIRIEVQEAAVVSLRQLASSLPSGVEWVNSWWVADRAQLICEWVAPDLDAVRSALAPYQEAAPIVDAHEVERIDPAWYD